MTKTSDIFRPRDRAHLGLWEDGRPEGLLLFQDANLEEAPKNRQVSAGAPAKKPQLFAT